MGSDALTLLDTHVLVWVLKDDAALGPRAKKRLERDSAQGALAVSPITFWEIGLLSLRGRLTVNPSGPALRAHVLGLGVQELGIDGAIAELAARLSPKHADPADCLLVASALEHGLTLVTADKTLLRWGGGLKALAADR